MNKLITLDIDGQEVSVPEKTTIIEAAARAQIDIPHLCYLKGLAPTAACRLCLVELEGTKNLVVSCARRVKEGMVVRTQTERVLEARRFVLELIWSTHPGDCTICEKSGSCQLQKYTYDLGIEKRRFPQQGKEYPLDTSNPFIERDLNLCILCGRCIRICQAQGNYVLDFVGRGIATKVTTPLDKPLQESGCTFCGSCISVCPVGCLVEKGRRFRGREWEFKTTKTVCPYCGCGCNLLLDTLNNQVVRARPLNENGYLCVKGRFGMSFVNHPERLTTPLIKRKGNFVEATWEKALKLITDKWANYQGDQFATIASAKCTNEENYIIQKFTRVVLGTNNIDHCARLCHAPTVMGLIQVIGSGAMSNPISDVNKAACILAIGTNTTEAHPLFGLKIKEAVNKGAKLIIANPRKINLCGLKSLWLQQRPGTDVPLLMGMCRVIVDEGLSDTAFIKERCENFDEFKKSLNNFDLDTVEQITSVPKEKIVEAAKIFAVSKPATTFWSMGITQHSHGTENVFALANLVMLTGNIGKPGSGVNPLRGQSNVQGACDLGCLNIVYPGYQAVTEAAVKKKFESAWGVPLNPQPGLTMSEVWPAAKKGKIKTFYIIGADPVLSVAGSNQVREGLKAAEFVVVQDIFLNETAKFADVILPACSFAEKEGTFTNSERRVQRIRKAIEPLGNSRPDAWIICQLAQRMGAKGFDYRPPEKIMDEIASLTPIYGGMSYERLNAGDLQWPCPDKEHPGTPILHVGKFRTKNGKGKFTPLKYKPAAELPDEEYPLLLTTERPLEHFHGVMTHKVQGLKELRGEELVEMNPEDARRLRIAEAEMVRVVSRRGAITVRAKLTDVSPPGVVCMSWHFAESPTNLLTNPALDPIAKTPETKVCAVRIEKSEKLKAKKTS